MIRTIATLAALATATPLAAQQEPAFGWLVGRWCSAPDPVKHRQTCETWAPMADGVMRGTSETRRGDAVVGEEKMEIRRDGTGYVYHAEPRGQAPADFRANADDVAELAVTFGNAEHDYPQRIRYWRDEDKLMAEIALADGSRAILWEYARKGD